MSARRGPLTLTRLFVKGSPARDLRKRYLEAIRLRAFTPLKPEDEGVEASGWCVFERPFDLEFDSSKIFEDRLLLLGFRIDRYRVPALLIRSMMAEEEARILARTGKNRVSRNERLELRDKIVIKLRKKLAPSTRAIDVVWDLDAGTVLFFSHSKRTLADFCALFEKTFGLELDEDSPYLAAERAELPSRLSARLGSIEPLDISRGRKANAAERADAASPPDADDATTAEAEQEPKDELFQRVETTRFLGPEFLLWIWLRAEFVNQPIELDERGAYDVWLDRTLSLESPLDRNERVTISGAAPTDGHEAREAVRSRKFPVRARIVLQGADRDFTTGLVAPRFALSGANVPAVSKQDESEALLERMTLAENLFSALDRLYGIFLRDRLGDAWKNAWEPAIAAWVEDQPVPASVLQQLVPPQGGRKKTRRASA